MAARGRHRMSSNSIRNGRDGRPASSPAVAGFRPLGLALALASAFGAAQAQTQSGMQAIHGTATSQTNGARTLITTTNGAGTGFSSINWQAFGVAPGTTTHF